jgi:hypothetical protein
MFGGLNRALDRVPHELGHVLVADKITNAIQRFRRDIDLCLLHIQWWPAHAARGIGSLDLGQRIVLGKLKGVVNLTYKRSPFNVPV